MTLELYHNDMSTCAQKVRLTLAEKNLNWQSHHMDLRRGDTRTPEYKELNPNAVVPTLIDEGKVICESTIIMEYLDDAYPEKSVRPKDPVERARVRNWTKQLDESLHAAVGTISGTVAFRHQMMAGRTKEETIAFINLIPQLEKRERSLDTTFKGIESRYFKPAIKRWDKLFSDMETTLSKDQWLTGKTYSLADIAYTPYLTRMDHLQFMGLFKNRPRILDWYERVKSRSNYSAISDWINKKYIPLMEEKGNEAWPRVEEILNTE
ncbi:MAG: glutathione S-transferase family protein [Pseudomonadota bacterium]|nr:glutathione S-transferase family protein [Pseudomonadota bacterium]